MDDPFFRQAPAPMRGILGWLQPRGGPIADGLRLAIINSTFLLLALILLGLLALASRVAGWLFPVPRLFPAVFMLLACALIAAFIWFRYGRAYRDAARSRGVGTQADVFGAIAAAPFVAFGLVLVASGLFGIFASAITLSPDRAWDAFTRIGYGILFGVIALASVVVARLSSSEEQR